MTETFQCASCSAPLEFDGQPMQKCQFCGNTVIVPSEVFRGRPSDTSSFTGHALKIAEIRELIAEGNKLMAIKVFRETFGVGLAEAKAAVEAMERGMGVDLSAIQMPAAFHPSPDGIKTLKRAGYTIGGSILATTGLILVFTVGLIAVIFYFTFRTVNHAFDTVANSIQQVPVKAATPSKSTGLNEVLRFGGDGNGAGRFKDNRSIATDGGTHIYGVDYSGGRLQVFDSTGKFQTQWDANSGGAIRDLAADHKGNVIVLDVGGLSVFDGASGKLVQKLDKFRADGVAATLDGKIVTTANGSISVLDTNLKTLQEFKDAGSRALAKAGFGKVAVNGVGMIYAVDRENGDVCKFTPDGKFVTRFPSGTNAPNAIAVDPKGRIFVAQVSKISVFDENGRPVSIVPATQAFGLAFDDAGGLLVASRPYIVKYDVKL